MKKILVNALMFMLLAYLLPGVWVSGFWSALWAAIIYAFIRMTLGLLLKIMAFPLNILTFGIVNVLINGFTLLTASHLAPGFIIQSYWMAVLMAIILSLVQDMVLGESEYYRYQQTSRW